MNYNQNRHLELLKRSQDFEKLGKIFSKEDFKNYLEFLKYQGAIDEYIFWKNRSKFGSLLKTFLNRIIEGLKFDNDLSILVKEIENIFNEIISELDSEKFQDFNPDVRLIGFGNLISFLKSECDNFYPDYDDEDFYQSMKDCFLKLQEVLDEEKD